MSEQKIQKINPNCDSITYDDILKCKNLKDEDIIKEFKIYLDKTNNNIFKTSSKSANVVIPTTLAFTVTTSLMSCVTFFSGIFYIFF